MQEVEGMNMNDRDTQRVELLKSKLSILARVGFVDDEEEMPRDNYHSLPSLSSFIAYFQHIRNLHTMRKKQAIQ